MNLYELHYTISHTSPQLSPLLWAPAPGNTSQEEWYSVWSWSGGDQWPLGYHLVVLVARLVCAASPSSGGLCRPGTRPSQECISTRREKTSEWSGILISFNDNLTPVSLHKIGKGRSKWENYHAWGCFCWRWTTYIAYNIIINVALIMCNFTLLSIYTVNNRKKKGAYTFMEGCKKLLIKWMQDLKEANKQSCGDGTETITQYILTRRIAKVLIVIQ